MKLFTLIILLALAGCGTLPPLAEQPRTCVPHLQAAAPVDCYIVGRGPHPEWDREITRIELHSDN
jgi:hypothetical protein